MAEDHKKYLFYKSIVGRPRHRHQSPCPAQSYHKKYLVYKSIVGGVSNNKPVLETDNFVDAVDRAIAEYNTQIGEHKRSSWVLGRELDIYAYVASSGLYVTEPSDRETLSALGYTFAD